MTYNKISDYGIIGNMNSAALVSIDGSIDWCCLPRFDSPAVFAALLDDEKGGRFQIKPPGQYRSSHAYISDSNVLQTTFETDEGTAILTDFMPCYRIPSGRLVRVPEIHRHLECTNGNIELAIVFQPALDYARSDTRLTGSIHGVSATDGNSVLALSATVPLGVRDNVAGSSVILKQGESTSFVLSFGSDKPQPITVFRMKTRMISTLSYWQTEVAGCGYTGRWREDIIRSYLTLHLLVYEPTGAIIAAPTTSLPEEIGGERNWDYRYAWLRDASFTLNAFSRLRHTEEAMGFIKFLLRAYNTDGQKAQILYNINFDTMEEEQTLDHLEGYRESRPVRIGNDAYNQLQLDVFGEVLDAVSNFVDIGGYIGHRDWELLESFVNNACELWHQPDNGIWEVRGGPFHFVHSKMMCWVAVDRGIKLAGQLGYPADLERWHQAAIDIREDIMKKGWDPEQGSFTQHYDTKTLDASNLLMPLFGFLPVTDEKMLSTIKVTIEKLSGRDGLLRRYLTQETDDGLSGGEGMFLWCSFWLVRIFIRLGRLSEAKTLYEKLLGYTNKLNLCSEMVDPVTGEALGNFPQALSHLAIIIAGLELNQALQE